MKIHVVNQNTICIAAETTPSAEEIREAFVSCGIPAEGEIQVAVFAGSCGVLLFATRTPQPAVYRFETLENTIGGAQAICAACASPTTLYYYDGAYFLTLGEDLPQLAEFGNAEENPALIGACLEEYGEILRRNDAVQLLSRVFHT
ncbi:MAG: adaptor protein MecA [Oscillospiraceae bacterium]|nr:adaptor protein MecA [Oscillospiraceae bacterium]